MWKKDEKQAKLWTHLKMYTWNVPLVTLHLHISKHAAEDCRGVYPYLLMATNAPWSFFLGGWTKSNLSMYICFIRPPVYGSNGRSYKMLVMFSFFLFLFRNAFSEVPRPIALKLGHMVGNCLNFIIQVQKFGGPSPKKIWGPKTCKISVDFIQPPTLIANISETAQDI